MTDNSNNLYDNITYEEISIKLNLFKQNLAHVQELIKSQKEKITQSLITDQKLNENLSELQKMEKDIKKSIIHMEDIKQFKIKTDPKLFNNAPIDAITSIGKICAGFYESEQQWFTAIINSVNVDDKTVDLTWLGYKVNETLKWEYVKIQDSVNPQELEVGMFCDAIYYDDGRWYQAVIEMISEHGVHVKYKKYENVEVLSYDSIRFTPEQNLLNEKRKEESSQKVKKNEDEFKLPEHLKITPADNEQQRIIKRKRAKTLKQNYKQKIIEKITKEKQEHWMTFKQNNKNKTGGILPMKKIGKKI